MQYPGYSTWDVVLPAGQCIPRWGPWGAVPMPVTCRGRVPQVLPHMPALPEAEQHLRPLPVHLPAHPAAPDQVSPALPPQPLGAVRDTAAAQRSFGFSERNVYILG